jgi:hypothetical protein
VEDPEKCDNRLFKPNSQLSVSGLGKIMKRKPLRAVGLWEENKCVEKRKFENLKGRYRFDKRIILQEVLRRTNRLLSFDTTRTA